MLIPELCGGLGNNLFQISSALSLAKTYNQEFGILQIPQSPHSNLDYNTTIFSKFQQYINKYHIDMIIDEKNLFPIQMSLIETNPDKNILLRGYYQNYTYIEPHRQEIIDLFDLESDADANTNTKINEDSYFLHIRRGDFVGNAFHYINLDQYYQNALKTINDQPKNIGSLCKVISNDIQWCEDYKQLQDIRVQFIGHEIDELQTLSLMKSCSLGGIAANSSFSWWGLYLNISRPYLIIPSTFFPHNILYQQGYYFPQATVCEI